MFTVAQLELVLPPADDPFKRPRPDYPPIVFVQGDTNEWKLFKLDRLLNKRTIRRGRGWSTEYLIRWKGYGPEFNQWYNVKDLENAIELVEEYEHGMAAIYEDPDSGVSVEQPL